MTYLTEVYSRFHWILTSVESWGLWFITSVILLGFIGYAQTEGVKYKNQITYYFIVLIVGSFILRTILWVFLPSPELLVVVK